MQRGRASNLEGKWFRWKRYQLANGILRAALPFVHEYYDPWGDYRDNDGRYRTVVQPYVAFLELNKALEKASEKGILPYSLAATSLKPSPDAAPNEATDSILHWCNHHGLLGIVGTLSSSICMPPAIRRGSNPKVRVVTQTVHAREGGHWRSTDNAGWPIYEKSSKRAESAARRELAERPTAGVTFLNRQSAIYEKIPLNKISDFFLSSGTTGKMLTNLPCPNTPGFWGGYGEPVKVFTLWCRIFSQAVNTLSRWKQSTQKGDLDRERIAMDRAFVMLNALANSAGPSFDFNPRTGTVLERRESAGLLASYALMFLWDFMDGRRAIRCHNCDQYFVSNEKKAQYCSVACRNTAQSRRYRLKKTQRKPPG